MKNSRAHPLCAWFRRLLLAGVLLAAGRLPAAVELAPADSVEGYLALLLINETPFPGERGWESEADSKAAMRQILWVLESRLRHVPPRYTQRQIATVASDDIIDIITAGGVHGQVEGFYRDDSGRPVTVPRVKTRVAYLLQVAGTGQPGTFARLLGYAQELASDYVTRTLAAPDIYEPLRVVNGKPVTGRAYSWMTDMGQFHPGGRFVRIPDDEDGSLGGNRFFTLQRLEP